MLGHHCAIVLVIRLTLLEYGGRYRGNHARAHKLFMRIPKQRTCDVALFCADSITLPLCKIKPTDVKYKYGTKSHLCAVHFPY
jgi:hypothetical protein